MRQLSMFDFGHVIQHITSASPNATCLRTNFVDGTPLSTIEEASYSKRDRVLSPFHYFVPVNSYMKGKREVLGCKQTYFTYEGTSRFPFMYEFTGTK